MRRMVIGVVLLMICPLAQAGKIYQWVDEQGNVHYTQTPPPQSAAANSEELNRSVAKVRPRKKGKHYYCGEDRLPNLRTKPEYAISSLEESIIGWEDATRRLREERAEYISENVARSSRESYRKRVRYFEQQIAENECKVAWARAQLAELGDARAAIRDRYRDIQSTLADLEGRKEALSSHSPTTLETMPR